MQYRRRNTEREEAGYIQDLIQFHTKYEIDQNGKAVLKKIDDDLNDRDSEILSDNEISNSIDEQMDTFDAEVDKVTQNAKQTVDQLENALTQAQRKAVLYRSEASHGSRNDGNLTKHNNVRNHDDDTSNKLTDDITHHLRGNQNATKLDFSKHGEAERVLGLLQHAKIIQPQIAEKAPAKRVFYSQRTKAVFAKISQNGFRPNPSWVPNYSQNKENIQPKFELANRAYANGFPREATHYFQESAMKNTFRQTATFGNNGNISDGKWAEPVSNISAVRNPSIRNRTANGVRPRISKNLPEAFSMR